MYSSLLILIIKWTNEWPMAAGDKQLEYLMRNNSQTHFSIHSLTNLDMKKKNKNQGWPDRDDFLYVHKTKYKI